MKPIKTLSRMSQPSFLKGVARTCDVFALIDAYNPSLTDEDADLKAIENDWEIVGADVAEALKKYDKNIRK